MKKIICNLDLAIACTAMFALVVYTFGGVVMRYFVGKPITWGEEFQIMCLVIVVFFSAGAGFRTKSHVAIDIVVDLMPIKTQKIVEFVVFVLTVLVLLYFTVQSSSLVVQMFETKRSTDILEIPYYIIYSAFPIGCVLMIANFAITFYERFTNKAVQG